MSFFKIKEINGGWIDGHIKDDKNSVDFSYSYTTDFLGDLLEEILFVLDNKKKCGIVDTEIEPGSDFWKIVLDNKIIIISLFLDEKHNYIINTEEDFFKIKERLVNENSDYNFKFTIDEFVNNFINEIENNLDKYNENYLKYCLDNRRTIDNLKKYIMEIKKRLVF